jgi:hypothetical protein
MQRAEQIQLRLQKSTKRKMRKVIFLFIISAIFASAEAQNNLQNLYTSKVIVTDDGKALIEKKGSLRLENSEARVKNIGNILNGAFQINAPGNTVKSITLVKDSMLSADVEFTSFFDAIRANPGRNVELEVLEADKTVSYEGLISQYGITSSMFILKTSYGSQAIPFNNIRAVAFSGDIENRSKQFKSYDAALLSFEKDVTRQQVELQFLREGFTWNARYFLIHTKNDQVQFGLNVEFINNAEDVSNTDIYFASNEALSQAGSTDNQSFYYGKRQVNILKGESLFIPIFSEIIPKTEVVSISLKANNPEVWKWNETWEDASNKADMMVEFTNKSDFDLVPGKIIVLDEFSTPLSDGEISFTAKGDKNRAPLREIDFVLGSQSEKVLKIKKGALKIDGVIYNQVDVAGVIEIENTSRNSFDLNLNKMVWGKINDDETNVDFSTIAKNYVNPETTISWSGRLTSKSKKKFNYVYTCFYPAKIKNSEK